MQAPFPPPSNANARAGTSIAAPGGRQLIHRRSTMRKGPCFASALAALALLLFVDAARPQTHVDKYGEFTVRSTVVSATSLSPQATRRYGIERRSTAGVLDIAVTRGADPFGPTVEARVAASKTNLLGQIEPIALRTVTENGRISYLGTFIFEPDRLHRFEITVQPAGTLEVFTQQFEERAFAGSR
jgi:hypothetical protein